MIGASRPPVVECPTPNPLRLFRQGYAPLRQSSFQISKRVEGLVYQQFVAERPQTLGRLQLRTVGGQLHQLQRRPLLQGPDIRSDVPARLIQHQQDLCLTPAHKSFEHTPKRVRVDARSQPELGLAALGTDKTLDVEPLLTRSHHHARTLAVPCPHAAQDGLEPDTVLVHRPAFDRALRLAGSTTAARLAHLGDGVFFKSFLQGSIRFLVTRARCLCCEAQAHEIIPATLIVYLLTPGLLLNPAGDLRSRPRPSIGCLPASRKRASSCCCSSERIVVSPGWAWRRSRSPSGPAPL